jgi:hypothetical protein
MSLTNFLLQWSYLLKQNGKELPIVIIPRDAFDEFETALKLYYEPDLAVTFYEPRTLAEVPIVGIRFRREGL